MLFLRVLKVTFLLAIVFQYANAQSSNSLAPLLAKADEQVSIGKYNQASALLKETLAQATKVNDKIYEAKAYDLLAEISIKKREFNEFKTYDALANKLATQLKDTSLLISLYNRKGIYYMEEGKNDLANIHYNTALNLSLAKKKLKNWQRFIAI